MNPLLPALGITLLVAGTLLFWAAIQNWAADLINRYAEQLGRAAYALQSGLIVLDRAIVTGQRVIMATLRLFYTPQQRGDSPVVVEELREVRPQDLPADVRERLERDEIMEYELSIGSMTIREKTKPNVTYRVAVRRAE
jgi:hypothetical protein